MNRRRPRLASYLAHAGVAALATAAAKASGARGVRNGPAAKAVVPTAIVCGWAAIAAAERIRPFEPEWREDHDGDTRQDLAFLVGLPVPAIAGRLVVRKVARRLPTAIRGEDLPGFVAVPLALAVYDLYHTLLHRLLHEWGPGWTVHSVHHSPKRLYWFNATRFHWIETFLDAAGEALTSQLIRLTDEQEAAYVVFRGVYGQLQHANVDLDSGALNRVFSTPELHRWHHSEIYEEGDNNYGAVLSIWDQAFGSYFLPGRDFDSALGVGRMPDFPTSWKDLQLAPFTWDEIRERNAETWYADDR